MKSYTITAYLNDDDDWVMKHQTTETFNPSYHLYPFRLADADNNLLAYGLSVDDSNFDPLDDYQDNWGCTTIEYWNLRAKTWDEL